MATVKELEQEIVALKQQLNTRCANIEASLNRLGQILRDQGVLTFSPFGFEEE